MSIYRMADGSLVRGRARLVRNHLLDEVVWKAFTRLYGSAAARLLLMTKDTGVLTDSEKEVVKDLWARYV